MKQFTVEQKIFIIVGSFGALVLLIAAAVIYPTTRYIKRINDDTVQLRTYLEKKEQNIMHLRNSKQKIGEIRDTLKNYDQYLFRPGDELKLITELENLANLYQVTQRIDNSNLDKITDRRVVVNLTVSGDYYRLWRYLSALEQSKYFFTVSSLLLSPLPSRDGNVNDANLNLHLTLYVNQ